MRGKIGVIASAGGSCITELQAFLAERGLELVVATDRACGIEAKLPSQRFVYTERDEFSSQVKDYFEAQGVEKLVLLYFTRFVGAALYESFTTLNFHPSLLPQYPGLHPLQQMLQAQDPVLGATAHEVDESCDNGPILGQISNHYGVASEVEHLSFLQKTFLSLAAIEHHYPVQEESVTYANSSLPLSQSADHFFRELEQREGASILE